MAQENKMYFSHPANKSYKQTGLALIELLVGIVVSLIALAFLLNIYLTNIRSTSETVNAARLDDDLRSTMTYMVEEIRRAGYWKNSVVESGGTTEIADPKCNPFSAYNDELDFTDCDPAIAIYGTNLAVSKKAGEENDTCITFTYDRGSPSDPDDPDGILQITNEYYGIRLSDGAIEIAHSVDCNSPDSGWHALTDPDVVTVKAPRDINGVLIPMFDLTDTVCTDVNESSATNTKSGGDCIQDYLDVSPALSEHRIVQNKVVKITLEGELRNDTAVSKRLEQTVNARNRTVAKIP
jgi:prepilin peptidase dependent protein B